MPSDDYGFWDDDRNRSHTGPIPRISRQAPTNDQVARRRADVNARRRVAVASPVGGHRRPVDPFVRRIGVLLAIGVVAAPIAMMVRGGDATPRLQAAQAPVVADQVVADQVAPGQVAPGQGPEIAAQPAPVDAPTYVAPTVATQPIVVAAPVAVTDAPTTSLDAIETTAATTAVAAAEVGPQTTVAAQLEVEAAVTTPPRAALAVDAASTKIVTCANPYKVAAGDYWIRVATKFSVKLSALLSINKSTVKTPLYPGRTICLPANATPPTTASPATTAAPSTTVKPKDQVKTTPTTAPPTTAPSTTAAPTTTTTPPPKNTYSRAQVEAIIRAVWPDDLEEEALRIATRESNLVPTVRNSCCYGLFQIYFTANRSSLAASGITSAAQLYDPQVNAYAAYAMYLRAGGWGPWKL